jgi:hypothetical protein
MYTVHHIHFSTKSDVQRELYVMLLCSQANSLEHTNLVLNVDCRLKQQKYNLQ